MFAKRWVASLSTIKDSLRDIYKGKLRLCVRPSEKDLWICADRYYNALKDPLIPLDLEVCKNTIREHVRNGSFIATIHEDAQLLGFIAGSIAEHPHSDTKVVSLDTYFSECVGMKAVNSLKLAGRGLIEYAKSRQVPYVIMTHNYNVDDSFNKILTYDGWTSRGHTSVFKIGD
jgi:hypothetical protein